MLLDAVRIMNAYYVKDLEIATFASRRQNIENLIPVKKEKKRLIVQYKVGLKF